MNFGKSIGKLAPLAILATASALSACGGNISFGGEEGVPLAELDTSGDAPSGVALGGEDNVVITSGDSFSIDVDGSNEAVERMRFSLEDGMLAIGRENGSSSGGGTATVIITMPAPETLALGGSGRIEADTMAGNAEIVVGGSGSVAVGRVEADTLEVTIGGSGSVGTAGSAEVLEVNVGGSGTADFAGLQVERAEVNIGGSGGATFRSNGSVEANIGGSGSVMVIGSATCEVNSVGSGSLVCEEEPAAEAADTDA